MLYPPIHAAGTHPQNMTESTVHQLHDSDQEQEKDGW